MLNPNIIYISVAVVFICIVAKFKIMPYLAARKILKASRKDTKEGTQSADPMQSQAITAPALPPSLMSAAVQSLLSQGAFPGLYPVQPAPGPTTPKHRDIYFDYHVIGVSSGGEVLEECRQVDASVNQYLADLRDRGIFPDTLGLLHLYDGTFLAYITYTR